jgi:Flp pilus assembly pilin Flp
MAERFRALRFFWSEQDGQDLEYSLLIVFVAVAWAAIVGADGSATVPFWSRANTQLSAASATAS